MGMATKMPRTLIALTPREMRWLKHLSEQRKQSMAAIVREAVVEYRVQIEKTEKQPVLQISAVLWKKRKLNALDYVAKLRSEWE